MIDAIKSSGVINLSETMVNSSAEGGKREELELAIEGLMYSRILEKTKHPAFRVVIRYL